jgi:RNA polymerase nonessential primary-like sigma factor
MGKAQIVRQSQPTNSTDTDMVRTYLREIGRFPLLTHEQEIVLGKQVREMMTLLEKKQAEEEKLERQLNSSEWANLVQMGEIEINRVVKLGQRAKKKIIEANLRLVVSIAKKYQKRNLDLLDLIQEGNLGLERGVEKFDPAKGYRFSTYAYWWIRQGITRAISNQGRTVRLPIHVIEKINKVKQTRRKLSQSLGRTATEDEIARESNLKLEQIQEYLHHARQPTSLNTRVGSNHDCELAQLLEDKGASPEDYVDREFLQQNLRELMQNLPPKYQQVLSLRFGLEDGRELSLAKIGQKMNLSRERVRQIENQALMQLRQKRSKICQYLLN